MSWHRPTGGWRGGGDSAQPVAAQKPKVIPAMADEFQSAQNDCGHSHPVHSPDSAFAPDVLREYALLADGERGILVGPRGEYAWMCAPRWHSDGVWSALVGGPGGYSVTPTDERFVWGGYYEQRSLIWRSRWVTTTGIIECREALAFPGDPHTAVVLRRIVAVDGDAEVRVRLAVRAGFGAHPMTVEDRRDDGFTATSGPIRMRWHAGWRFAFAADGTAEAVITIPAGSSHDLILELGDRPLPVSQLDADDAWHATESAWHQAVPALRRHFGRSRRPPRVCGAAGSDRHWRRHGRGGDDVAARARRTGPQLRLPLRLGARSVLRRAGRRRRRSRTSFSTQRSDSSPSDSAPTGRR